MPIKSNLFVGIKEIFTIFARTIRSRGRAVRQRSAKPCTPVRIRTRPLKKLYISRAFLFPVLYYLCFYQISGGRLRVNNAELFCFYPQFFPQAIHFYKFAMSPFPNIGTDFKFNITLSILNQVFKF